MIIRTYVQLYQEWQRFNRRGYANYDTILSMESNLSPAARALIAAALVFIPILLVILQRWEDIREILRRRKAGEKLGNLKEFLNPISTHAGQGARLTIDCLNCGAENPRGQAFCGACGKRLEPIAKDEICE